MPANAADGRQHLADPERHVSDPDSDPLTVTFFGRPLASGNYTQIAQNTNVTSSTDSTTTPGPASAPARRTSGTQPSRTRPTPLSPDPTGRSTPQRAPTPSSSAPATSDRAPSPRTRIPATSSRASTAASSPPATTSTTAAPPAEFANCYATTPWGDPSVKSRTRPVPGNHDWGNTGTASDNLNGYFGYYGPNATDGGGKSYYSYDIPSSNWHIVNLDSECEDVPGGCAAGSPQELWLKADLAANSTKNVIALWHKPRYSSGATQYQAVQPLWDDLYAAGVDILLDGHDHIYERHGADEVGRHPRRRRPSPIRPTGSRSSRSARGARGITDW